MKDETKIFKIAQKINDYNEDTDGCVWSDVFGRILLNS